MRTITVILALLILFAAPATAMQTMEPTPRSIAADARAKRAKNSGESQAPTQTAPDKPGRGGGSLIIRTAPDGQTTGTPKPPAPKE